MTHRSAPAKQGLYDPAFEHDACGVGFVVDAKGRKSNAIIPKALKVLLNLEHRGACGCEVNTGDGAGILVQIAHTFFARQCADLEIDLPRPGEYGVGMVFLPTDRDSRRQCERVFERVIREEGQKVLGWRTVPTDDSTIGPTARRSEPVVKQILIGRVTETEDQAFERRLYIIRKRVERAIKDSVIQDRAMFYIPSLSCKTIVYKGMLTSPQLPVFYPDLSDSSMETALALVHSRFSTNTFPSWARAHPYRYVAHNGEINTLRGNVNWTVAREKMFKSALFGPEIEKILPVVDQDGSDTAIFDNVLEMLTLAGRSLPHSVMMMIPEPWSGHEGMSEEKRAFYEYHSCLMEAWDGPASITFTDGIRIGAVLDRNGLRPSRYYVTKDDLVIMASEVGVLDIPPENILLKGRLQPGRMFLVDTEQGRIVGDDELKHEIATQHPYRRWLRENMVRLDELPDPLSIYPPDHETVLSRQEMFGYTKEDLSIIMGPMARGAGEALGSMGSDIPLAVLSDRPQLLYSYFKQLFAQVTNPPVDAFREELIMSTDTTIGPEANMLEPTPECARQIKMKSPILNNKDLERLRRLDGSGSRWGSRGFKSITLRMLYKVAGGGAALQQATDELCRFASDSIKSGYDIIVLSDRRADEEHAPIPALLAVSAIHHHLIREGTRTQVGLILETGEPREVHHFALLLGYGAAAINPYLAFDTLQDLVRQGMITGVTADQAIENFRKAVSKGIVKVISKMGISMIQSYCGAQIFEAIGLDREVVDQYFTGTPSRLGGINLEVIAREASMRHQRAFPGRPEGTHSLDEGGLYKWRSNGEYHLFNPETIHKLQHACRRNDYGLFKEYSSHIDNQSRHLCTLRGLMDLKPNRPPVPIEEVEPVEAIVSRFKTGAMSYGSISKEAHETLAIAMNRIGGKSNTGEGGEDPARYLPDPSGDSRNSAIKQVASARFGVTSNYLVNARELQIKMAQGAKPGEGGQLPGHKVDDEIARVRHSIPGVGLISPPPHHDIYSIEDLAQLIYDLKNANPKARISVKLVAEVGVGTVAAGVSKAHADVVLISGDSGGTGASPLSSIKHAGIPWELGLAETQQVLVMNDLRGRIRVQTDGKLQTGRDVTIAALLGAEEFGFSTAPLISMGCIMMRKCHLNTCPVGIATQDKELRKKFQGKPEHVINFFFFIAEQVRQYMAQMGFRRFDEMVGRVDMLDTREALDHWKAKGIDLSMLLYNPPTPSRIARRCIQAQDHGLSQALDYTLIGHALEALETGAPLKFEIPIRNVHRTVGAMLSGEIARRYGSGGLPDDTMRFKFTGSAGQSFGAFLAKGVTLELEGDANDYVGKGLSGGKLVVYPPRQSTFLPEENILIGNVVLYGATSGEAYFNGMAGERFAVRNSGATAVIEGLGDHGCEYMTKGMVVVLGKTGRNFAAGMSGGIAFVLDEEGDFAEKRCNTAAVDLEPVVDADADLLYDLISGHVAATGSPRAKWILENWQNMVGQFIKVFPHEYKRVLGIPRLMAATA